MDGAFSDNGGHMMWVLMYVFSYSINPMTTNDRAEWRLQPSVVFQEFSSEARCHAAKIRVDETLKAAGSKLKIGLAEMKSLGIGDPAQLIIAYSVECLEK
jgi:hypothetical protein